MGQAWGVGSSLAVECIPLGPILEVFGRTPGYDTRLDSVVRTEAAKLRTRLAEYYAGDGAADPVVIELPKGGYTPVFHQIEAVRETTAAGPDSTLPRFGRRRTLRAAIAGVAIASAAIGLWWLERRSALGLTDEIIRNLSILDGLAVRSRTSSFAFKGKARDLRDAGRQLEAEYILEGSVMRGPAAARKRRKWQSVQTHFNQAVTFAGLGDKERALEAMEGSTAAGPFRVGRQLTWPELAAIRGDPRMKALRKKVGLPE